MHKQTQKRKRGKEKEGEREKRKRGGNVWRNKPSGHEVVDVHDLDEGTDGGAAHDLALGHGLGDLAGSVLDASEEAVRELVALGLGEGLEDDGLLAGIAAVEDDDDATSLDEALCHVGLLC